MKPLSVKKIPRQIFANALYTLRDELGYDMDKFTHQDCERLKRSIGEHVDIGHLPPDDFRSDGIRRRKGKQFVKMGGHSARTTAQMKTHLTPEYLEYLESDEWRKFADVVIERWSHRCACCYIDGKLDVHHRTYERFRNEDFFDVIPLCRNCHKKFHDRRVSEYDMNASPRLF